MSLKVVMCCSHIYFFFLGGGCICSHHVYKQLQITCQPSYTHTRSHLELPVASDTGHWRMCGSANGWLPLMYVYFQFLLTVVFSHLLCTPPVNKATLIIWRCPRPPTEKPATAPSPLEAKRVLDVSNDPQKSVVCAQQLCINVRAHINRLYAGDAGRGRRTSSINSALSSSAVLQTWINGVINLSLQMHDFSTSILFPCWLTVPSPSKSVFHAHHPRWPARPGELFAILSIRDLP